MQRNQSEDQAQRATVEWLRAFGWSPASSLNGAHLHGNKIARIKQWARLVRLGALKGATDFIILEPAPIGGRHVAIEMKASSGGVVSDDQKAVHKTMRAAGWTVLVCRGSQAAINQLEKLGYDRFNKGPQKTEQP